MATASSAKTRSKQLYSFILVALGCLLESLGVSWFVASNGLVIGGVTGSAILLKNFCEVVLGFSPVLGLVNFTLSIPVFIFSFFVSGFKFIKRSIFAMLLVSFWLSLLRNVPDFCNLNGDLFCASICAGVLCGLGTGLMLKVGASSGGADMFANDFNKLFPQFSIPSILFVFDFFVISLGLFFFKMDHIVYSVVMSFVCSRMVNSLLGGLRFARAVFIFSDKTDEISNRIFEILNRGNTQLSCKGMYTKKDKHMLMVVVMPKEISKLKAAIELIDKKAFVVICPAQEVLGNGF